MRNFRQLLFSVLAAGLTLTSSCADKPGVTYASRTGTYMAGGAVAGGIIGNNTKFGTWEGAAVGAVLGALLGEIAGRPNSRSNNQSTSSGNLQYQFR